MANLVVFYWSNGTSHACHRLRLVPFCCWCFCTGTTPPTGGYERVQTATRGGVVWGGDYERQCLPGTYVTAFAGSADGALDNIIPICSNGVELPLIGSKGSGLGEYQTRQVMQGYTGVRIRAADVIEAIMFLDIENSTTSWFGDNSSGVSYSILCPTGEHTVFYLGVTPFDCETERVACGPVTDCGHYHPRPD